MKKHIFLYTLSMLPLVATSQPVSMPMPQGNMMTKQQSQELTFQDFINQPGIQVHKAYFTIYQKNDRFCLEIPKAALGRDILVSAQVVKGYGNYVSPASDVIRFEYADKRRLIMRHNRSIDLLCDSTDMAMAEAIHNSTMLPIDRSLTIMTTGEKNDSYIVDITSDINQSSGLFDVSKMNSLSHPDATRSGITAIRPIQNGVTIEVYRSQTDNMAQGQMGNMQDVAVTTGLEFVIQLLPEHTFKMKPAVPAFGFQTITRQEYDTRDYTARRQDYICHWHLSKGHSITLSLDPSTPAPFRQCIKNAIAQWQSAFRQAGFPNALHLSEDPADRSLSYGHIYLAWGNAASGISSTNITNPVTGEIMAARVNLQDTKINDIVGQYYMMYRTLDRRVAKDIYDLGMRCDRLTAELAAQLGQVFGLRANWRGNSVTAPLRLNHAVTDGNKTTQLFPHIGSYDIEAVQYAYGKGKSYPKDKQNYFSGEDAANPFARKLSLPGDILAQCKQAIELIKQNYATLHKDINRLPNSQNSFNQESMYLVRGLGLIGDYMQQIASLVGGRQQWPIIRNVSEQPVTYIPRQQQLAALNYLEQELLGTFPTWMMRSELVNISSANPRSMTIGTANSVLTQLMSADVLQRLAEQEHQLGTNAYTPRELIDYIERLVFINFDASRPLDDIRQKEQINLMLTVAGYVQQHNIVMGMQNEGNCLLQVWLVDTARKIRQLATSHSDLTTRQHYDLLTMRLDRAYFNKTVQ